MLSKHEKCLLDTVSGKSFPQLSENKLFSEALQSGFASPAFSMNYCTVLSKLRSQVKDSYEVLWNLVSFFALVMEPVKFTLAGNISSEAKLVKVARSLDSIVVFFLPLRTCIGCNMVILFRLNRHLRCCLLSIPGITKLQNGVFLGGGVISNYKN